jgi:non-specific serine/threonine protein kinase
VTDPHHARARPLTGVGPLLDERAKMAYRRRLDDLGSELEEAERFADVGRAARARTEMEALRQQLAAAVGLGGRDREQASPTERARVTVTKRVKDVLRRITAVHPPLGHHLTTCIRTGGLCVYLPPPGDPPDWAL